MINSIKTLKKYYKVTLNVLLIKTIFDDDKKIIYRIDFLLQIKILLLSM